METLGDDIRTERQTGKRETEKERQEKCAAGNERHNLRTDQAIHKETIHKIKDLIDEMNILQIRPWYSTYRFAGSLAL